jgi:hypothetical protein
MHSAWRRCAFSKQATTPSPARKISGVPARPPQRAQRIADTYGQRRGRQHFPFRTAAGRDDRDRSAGVGALGTGSHFPVENCRQFAIRNGFLFSARRPAFQSQLNPECQHLVTKCDARWIVLFKPSIRGVSAGKHFHVVNVANLFFWYRRKSRLFSFRSLDGDYCRLFPPISGKSSIRQTRR